jgi:hypothetical protein
MAQNSELQAKIAATRASVVDLQKQAKLRAANLERLTGEGAPAAPAPAQPTMPLEDVEPILASTAVGASPSPPVPEAPLAPSELEELREQLRKSQEQFNWAEGNRRKAERQAAEVQRLLQEKEQAAAVVEQRLRDMESEKARSAPITNDDISRLFSPEQIESLGLENCRAVIAANRTLLAEGSAAAIKAATSEIQRELAQTRQESAQSRKAAFDAGLLAAVPNWRLIDNSAAFSQWLDKPDEISGRLRREIGADAFTQFKVSEAVAIYKQFESETQQKKVPSAVPTTGMIPSGRSAAQPSFEAAPPKEVFKIAQVKRFESDLAKGVYRNKPHEAADIRQRIFQAQREGRIVA